MFEQLLGWFLNLGEQYGVDPMIFALIYVGSTPLFLWAVSWLIDNHRKDKSIILPASTATFFFISVYIYVFITGKNIPTWVYLLIAGIVVSSGSAVITKVRNKIVEVDHETGSLFADREPEIESSTSDESC